MQTFLSKAEFRYFFIFAVAIAAGVVFLVVVALTWAGGWICLLGVAVARYVEKSLSLKQTKKLQMLAQRPV